MRILGASVALLCGTCQAIAADGRPKPLAAFIQKHCVECHDAEAKQGELNLAAAAFTPDDPKNFALWVKVHDRVRAGEMPPKEEARPEAAVREEFLTAVAAPLIQHDLDREAREGRTTLRRMNRLEYENTLRDLLQAPWLQVKDILPEDGESHRFNKSSAALDVSHVQMAQYLAAAEYALRQVLATQPARPEAKTVRYYAREQKTFINKMTFTVFNRSPERATFPVLGTVGQPEVRSSKRPLTVGAKDPQVRDEEAFGVVASSYEPIELRFDRFEAPRPGRYKLRFSGYSVWAGAGPLPKWWVPDLDTISPGRRSEPVTVYSETRPRQLRWQGAFDFGTEPTTRELDVWLLQGEFLRVDAARLFRSRPSNWHNPLAEKDGQPGVAFRWMEVEGPLIDEWPSAGHKLLFDTLPVTEQGETTSAEPLKDAERLLRKFIQRAYRRPVVEPDIQRFLTIIRRALNSDSSFAEAMLAGYSGVLCSPGFVCLEEQPGALTQPAVATRLSYFLSNSEPDPELRSLAAEGKLRSGEVLRQQTERLLNHSTSRRFVDAFVAYWLDLRKMNATSPDAGLYPDYYLDDLLTESATAETELFFAEMVKENLPVRNVVASDFAMLNERLAAHYGLPTVDGVQLRKVALPKESPRGGLLTQASVLKVTANGTTTSPVLRGAWVMERILGQPPSPPPPSVPAVEPDIRGAVSIRAQLEKHRQLDSCSTCHAKIDPAGFALENFDVFGGWREQYRALGDGKHEVGFGKNGQPFAFHLAQPVDAGGILPDGREFANIREMKNLLLTNERGLARNLAQQLIVYATGAPVRFGDRPRVERILDQAEKSQFGVRDLIQAIVASDLFLNK